MTIKTLQFLRSLISEVRLNANAPDLQEAARLIANATKELDAELGKAVPKKPQAKKAKA